MCIDADIGRFVFTAGMILALSIGPARSIEFPGTCIKPPATVTNIAGINTRKAMMEGRYTLPDIIQACNQGYVDQGSYPTPKECIKNNRDLVNSPPLHAEADCVAGVITVEGLRTTLPAHADCASGGIRAIAAFKTLCPSYGGEIERAVPVFSQAGRESEDAGREAQRIADEVRSNASIANLGARKGLIAKMSVAATPTNPPTITGTTNLPNGTKLMATLTADRPCAPNCVAQAQTVVENGRFIVPSESIRAKIMAGPYTIEIVTPSAHLQPENVQAVIGRLGEYLEGPYVVTLSKDGYVPRSVNPSEFERMSGYSIRHVEKINVPRSTAPKAYWFRIEADNGAVYAIDMNSVSQNINGTAVAVTCIVDNDTCPPWNMSRFHFDCRGHYKDLDRHGPVMIAPPRSVAGQMAALACAGAKDTRLADDSENARTVRRPLSTDYCVDFTPDACERIKKVVEAYKPSQPPPSYCKPGFALVGSGLTDEQLRICYVITGFKRDTQNARSPKLVAASVVTAPEKTVETVIAHWSGKGNGKSGTFHIKRGTWEFCVTSTRSISGGIYKAADRTGVSAFGFQEPGDRLQLTSTGSFYFVVKTEGNWDITVVSLFPKVQ